MMKRTFLSASVLGVMLMAPSAMAGHHENGDGAHKGDKMFEKLDADSNGVITREEFLTNATQKFDAMDADKNGSVTLEEAKKHYEEKRKKWQEMKKDKAAE